MGSYITIGFVFNGLNINMIKNKLKFVIEYLSKGNFVYKTAKASKDIDGNNWIELKIKELSEIEYGYKLVSENYYGKISIDTFFLKNSKIPISIRVSKEISYFGILVDIPEECLLKSVDIPLLSSIDDLVIEIMQKLYSVLKYEYAFCDHEAELEFSPSELETLAKKRYSIIIKKNNVQDDGRLEIVKNNWFLDGITYRKLLN